MRSQKGTGQGVGHALALASQAHARTVVGQQTLGRQPFDLWTSKAVEIEAGLVKKIVAINALRASEIQRDGLAGALLGAQSLRLEDRRRAGQGALDVAAQVARIDLAVTLDIAG